MGVERDRTNTFVTCRFAEYVRGERRGVTHHVEDVRVHALRESVNDAAGMFHDRRFSPQPGVVVACIPVAAGGDKPGDEPSHRSGSGDDTGIVEHVAPCRL